VTLACTLDELAGSGFVEHFGVRGDALRSFDTGRAFSADQVTVREYHRFEGASDPDDMAIVYAIEAPGGVRGTLVDAFGAYSDPRVAAFLDRVAIRGASPFGGGTMGRAGMFDEPRINRAPPRVGAYHHGLRVPVPADPWHDEGGESGSIT
jgi:hypothetical protein